MFCRYKASDIRQIDSRIHFLKSKLADEEHKYATLAFASEQHCKDIATKNALLASLQQQSEEMKLSFANTQLKICLLDDEIQVIAYDL
jgi:hypothetical protein